MKEKTPYSSSSQPSEEQLYGRRILLFSYGSGLASSMYSVVCRKVHECRFTLAQLQRSIQRARHRLDYERVEIPPEIVDKLLSEREQNDHRGRIFIFEYLCLLLLLSSTICTSTTECNLKIR